MFWTITWNNFMAENKQKALIYCRVSSERQKTEGHGLDSQEHRCRQYCLSKYEVEKVFLDSASGGGDFMKRPAMSSMIEYIDKYPYRNYVVVFDDLSRFARDTIFHLKLRATFKIRGVMLKCLNFDFDDSPEGVFSETILAANNELDREKNRRQVIQKMKARLERGYWPFYPPPGFTNKRDPVHGKLLTPDKKAEIIKEALEGFATGRLKEQVDVRKFLELNDFNNGKPVYLQAIARLFSRIVYAGYIEYEPWEVKRRLGHHQAIISLETFQGVQDKMNGNTRCFSRKDTRPDFPLRGYVLCSTCKQPLTASWCTGRKKKHAYYRCNHFGCILKDKSIKKDKIEGEFSDVLTRAKAKSQIVDYTKALFLKEWENKMANLGQITARKEKELSEIIEEKEGLIKKITRVSDIVAKEIEKRIEELSNQELNTKGQTASPESRGISFGTALETTLTYLKNPHKQWEIGTLDDKRLVLKLVFTDRIPYDYENGFGTANYSLPIKAFELLATSKSQGVDWRGVEPLASTLQKWRSTTELPARRYLSRILDFLQ